MVYYNKKYIDLYNTKDATTFYYVATHGGTYFKNICLRVNDELKTPYGYATKSIHQRIYRLL